jgi:hypothetical protein
MLRGDTPSPKIKKQAPQRLPHLQVYQFLRPETRRNENFCPRLEQSVRKSGARMRKRVKNLLPVQEFTHPVL